MKQSINTDKQCIEKVIKNIQRINLAFEHFNITSIADLKNCELAQLAISQICTNIYEIKARLQDDTLNNMTNFKAVNLKTARNIASHDYDSMDFTILYKRCLQLTSEKIYNELNNFLEVIINDNQTD